MIFFFFNLNLNPLFLEVHLRYAAKCCEEVKESFLTAMTIVSGEKHGYFWMDVNGEKLFLQMVLLQHLPAGAKLTNHLATWLMYRCISPVGGSEVLVVKTGLPSTVLYLFCAFRWNLWFNQCSLASHGHLVFSFLYCFSFLAQSYFCSL